MNRKAFLTAIIAIITAPFVKGQQPITDAIDSRQQKWDKLIQATLQQYDRATFRNVQISEKDKAYINEMQVNTAHLREVFIRQGWIRGRIK